MAQQIKRQFYTGLGYDYRPTTVPGVYTDLAPERKKKVRVIAPVRKGRKKAPDPMINYIEGAEWWLAFSANPVRKIMRMFSRQDVASLLFEHVGAMKEFDSFNHPSWRFIRENPNTHEDELHIGGTLWRIAIQIVDLYLPDGEVDINVDVSLVDAGIWVQGLWIPEEETAVNQ
jgi:hypothetical protein